MFSILDNYNEESFNENEHNLIQTICDVNRYHGNGNITRAYELCMDMDYIINKIYIQILLCYYSLINLITYFYYLRQS